MGHPPTGHPQQHGAARPATARHQPVGHHQQQAGSRPASSRARSARGAGPPIKVSGYGIAPGAAYAGNAATHPPRRPATAAGGGGIKTRAPPGARGATVSGAWQAFSGYNGAPNISKASGLPPTELMAEATRVLEMYKVSATPTPKVPLPLLLSYPYP